MVTPKNPLNTFRLRFDLRSYTMKLSLLSTISFGLLSTFLVGASTSDPIVVSDRAVILTCDQARRLVKQCSRTGPENVTDFWMPSLVEIDSLEKALPRFIADKSGLRKPISAYCRQYVGLIVNGRKLIYVNALLASEFENREADAIDWRKEPVTVCDGGADAWGVEFDVSSRRFEHFAVNGAP
jgi:hypothetical protein